MIYFLINPSKYSLEKKLAVGHLISRKPFLYKYVGILQKGFFSKYSMNKKFHTNQTSNKTIIILGFSPFDLF